jgi:hypothetical protein
VCGKRYANLSGNLSRDIALDNNRSGLAPKTAKV